MKKTVTISAKDDRNNGIVAMEVKAKLRLSGQTPAESKRTVEEFRDRLFELMKEYFYVSEIKQ